MTDVPRDNVILFPKTVEYYQFELTRMLETEQYFEAARLLRFLLQCRTEQPQTAEEWQSLLEWLETTFSVEAQEEEPDETERELLKRHIQDRAKDDGSYVHKWLQMLLEHPSFAQKMLALEQLTFIDHPHITETIKRWLEHVDLHPLVQFKVLQILRIRGVDSTITINKCGEEIDVNISEVPLQFDDFPPVFHQVLAKVQQTSEVSSPSLAYFAEQTWIEFVSYIYGTSVYFQLVSKGESGILLWAGALHHVLRQSMLDSSEESDLRVLYQVPSELYLQWDQACWCIQGFIESAFRPE